MDDVGRQKLWSEYAKTKAPQLREKIIVEYAPLVKVVAGRLSMYLGYNVEYDDLVGYGVLTSLILPKLSSLRPMHP